MENSTRTKKSVSKKKAVVEPVVAEVAAVSEPRVEVVDHKNINTRGYLPWQVVDGLVLRARVEVVRAAEALHELLQDPASWPEGMGEVDHARACDAIVRGWLKQPYEVLTGLKPSTMRPCDREVRVAIADWIEADWVGNDASAMQLSDWAQGLVRLLTALHRHRELSVRSAKKAIKRGAKIDLRLLAQQAEA